MALTATSLLTKSMISLRQSNKFNIGKRLRTAAETAAVRLSSEKEDKPLCAVDVGTDHALLALALVGDYGFSAVTATDINEGPCKSARKNISAAGSFYEERIDVIRTDGLSGLEAVCADTDRIIIAGMGGELIRTILENADFVRRDKERIKFVLQPQSKQHILRKYLFENGYRLLGESWIEDAGKTYCIISAVYDGVARKSTLFEKYFGIFGNPAADSVFKNHIIKKYLILKNNEENRKGRLCSKENAVFKEEKALLCELEQYIKERNIAI